MLNENAVRWVQALRSREYAQGWGRLLTDAADGQESFCCLGVLCAISPFDRKLWEDKYYLPEPIAHWIGLQTQWGKFVIDGRCHTLTVMNDGDGNTFAEIADLIESAPEGLFVHRAEEVEG